MKWHNYKVNPIMWRKLFQKTLLEEQKNTTEIIHTFIYSVYKEAADCTLEEIMLKINSWKENETKNYIKLIENSPNQEIEEFILINSTPMASRLGAWLQGFNMPGHFEDIIQLNAMSLYASDVFAGKPGASRYDTYRTLLQYYNLSEISCQLSMISYKTEIDDKAFCFPSIISVMSKRPDLYSVELIVLNLIFRTIGTLPCWGSIYFKRGNIIKWQRLDLSKSETGTDNHIINISQTMLNTLCLNNKEFSDRANKAAVWIFHAIAIWSQDIFTISKNMNDPTTAMKRLVISMVKEGIHYHHKFKLNGKSLSKCLEKAQSNPTLFLNELASSKLIVPGSPENSLFINNLISPQGKMFRIFSKKDIKIISKWILSLENKKIRRTTCLLHETDNDVLPMCENMEITLEFKQHYPKDFREAYYLLHQEDCSGTLDNYSKMLITKRLSQAKYSLLKNKIPLPQRWHPDILTEWISEQHKRSNEQYQRNINSPLPSRDVLISSTLQLAPLILIDGAWLRKFMDYQLASSDVGYLLFNTFWDELGNGNINLNHPKIYRDLLMEMGIRLPETRSTEFAYHDTLHYSSFKLPVYWLCIGRYPITYMPEILGMNLAMELSGVGGSYMASQNALKHYGYSDQFVKLHNTIDNVATGHSAWAATAIDNYMQQYLNLDTQAIDIQWYRIKLGFESLNPKYNNKFGWHKIGDLFHLYRDPFNRRVIT